MTRELLQRVVQHEQFAVDRRHAAHAFVERHPDAAGTLRRLTLARVVDQDPPHGLRRHAKELRPVEPRHALLSHQADVRLVHERRRLQRVIAALAPQVRSGPFAKLLVDEGDQVLSRLKIAARPLLQQMTDPAWSLRSSLRLSS